MVLPPGLLDLTDLDLLLTVQRLGSLGKAAREHRISQPAASARIQAVERRLGLRLLERSPSGSRLTPAGVRVARWGRAVVDAASDLLTGTAALRDAEHGWLRVAAGLTTAEYLMPRWLTALRARLPEVTVELRVENSHEVAQRVRSGEVDLGFVGDPCAHAGLMDRPVVNDQLGVIVAPSHPWAGKRRPLTADELAAGVLVLRERGSGAREVVDRVLGELCDGVPHLELASTTAVKHAVAAGVGAAVISVRSVEDELRTGRLVTVPVAGVDLSRRLRAVWRTSAELPLPAMALVELALAESDGVAPPRRLHAVASTSRRKSESVANVRMRASARPEVDVAAAAADTPRQAFNRGGWW